MNKKKISKIIGIILLIFLIVFISLFVRKFIIVKRIANNLEEMISNNNYYVKINHEGSLINDRHYTIYKRYNDMKYVDNVDQIMIEFSQDKIYTIDLEKQAYVRSDNPTFLEDFNQRVYQIFFSGIDTKNLILVSLLSNISTEQYNDTECYAISLKSNNNVSVLYINKDNLMILANKYGLNAPTVSTDTYEFEFNNITENDFISEEEILQNYNNLATSQENN